VKLSRARLISVVAFASLAVASCGAGFNRAAAQKRIDVELTKRSSPTADARTCVGEKVAAYSVTEVKALDKALAAGTDTDPTVVKLNGDLSECRRPELIKTIMEQIDTGGGPSLTDANKACLEKGLKARPADDLEKLKVETKLDEPTSDLGKSFELELFDCSRDTIATLLADEFASGLSGDGSASLSPAERTCIADYVAGLKASDLRDAVKDDSDAPTTPAGEALIKKTLTCATPSIVQAITTQVDAKYKLDADDKACVSKVLLALSPDELLALSKAGNSADTKDTAAAAALIPCYRGVFAAAILEDISSSTTISPGYRACVTAAVRKFTDAEFRLIVADGRSASAKALLARVDVACPNLTV
jgi:hypothetical protein